MAYFNIFTNHTNFYFMKKGLLLIAMALFTVVATNAQSFINADGMSLETSLSSNDNAAQVTTTASEVVAVTLSVYPNPVADVMFIDGADAISKITVVNSIGAVVMQVNSPSVHQINVSTLNNGVYIVVVENGSEVYTNRFIKK